MKEMAILGFMNGLGERTVIDERMKELLHIVGYFPKMDVKDIISSVGLNLDYETKHYLYNLDSHCELKPLLKDL